MHWSLLLVHMSAHSDRPMVYHLDSSSGRSSRGGNYGACADIEAKLSKLLRKPVMPTDPIPCPQQMNSYDCGVYVILFVECIMRMISTNATHDANCMREMLVNAVSMIRPQDALACRGRFREDINLLVKSKRM
jgi:hypothetical protein